MIRNEGVSVCDLLNKNFENIYMNIIITKQRLLLKQLFCYDHC